MVVGRGLLFRLGTLRLQMVPLVLALIDDAGSRAQALDARGFGSPGPRTSYREVADPPAQRLFRAAALVLAAAAVAGRIVSSWPAGAPSWRPTTRTALQIRIEAFTFHGEDTPGAKGHRALGHAGFADGRPGRLWERRISRWANYWPAGSGPVMPDKIRGSLELGGTVLEFRGVPDDPRINPAEWSRRVAFVPQDAAGDALLGARHSRGGAGLRPGKPRDGPGGHAPRGGARAAARTGLSRLLGPGPGHALGRRAAP